MQARKRFGQHFLEPAWVEKLIDAIAPRADQDFIEIGPGHGALTRPLASLVRSIVAVEIDRSLAAELRRMRLANVKVVEGDFLRVSPEHLRHELAMTEGARSVRAVGNLPYNAASPILFRLIALQPHDIRLSDAVVMLQREVAGRLTAVPGTRDYGVLTVLVEYSASVELLFSLPPGAFRPAPKVHSALVRLRFQPPDPPARNPRVFAALVQTAFNQRRKTLANAIKTFAGTANVPLPDVLAKAGLDHKRRPETLALAEWIRLADIFAEHFDAARLVTPVGAVL
jgi:16S rRNA (adenine1518-N6/adenine1519-N6)-dimethyltransferase